MGAYMHCGTLLCSLFQFYSSIKKHQTNVYKQLIPSSASLESFYFFSKVQMLFENSNHPK